ncbi:hypothetical protein Q6264_29555, partial [Klebsiella pneumoniae]|nr:hypothetical protein [Klebsiella pneumoniae]
PHEFIEKNVHDELRKQGFKAGVCFSVSRDAVDYYRQLSRFDSVGQQRMAALHGGSRDNLEVSPNLWAGVGLVRGGAGTALVGDG